jgi:ABC-2 type transport system ATP-binding protein
VQRAISLTGQYAAVDDKLTGAENLVMMAELWRLPRRAAHARANELLAEFGLADAAGRRVSGYSGGMRRRLDLAISMISRPALLFLDEPTTGLDPRSREQLWGTVRRLVGQGVTVLLTTQYLEEADQLADMVCLLDHGRVIARGRPEELKASLGREVVRLRFADAGCYQRALDTVHPVTADGRLRTADVTTDGTAASVARLLGRLEQAGAPAEKVAILRPSLDDVFLSLTGGDGPHPAANVPHREAALRGVRRGHHRGRRGHRYEHRHRGPVPLHAGQRCGGAGRAHRRQPGP